MEIMVEAILAVVSSGVTSEDGLERVHLLSDGLREGFNLLRGHCRKHRAKAFVPANKALLAALIDEDLKVCSQRLFAAAVALAIENMPPVVVPTWSALSHYIDVGGLMGAPAPAAVAWEPARAEKRARPTLSGAGEARYCWAWMEKAGCHFENCICNHPTGKKCRPGRGQDGGGARGSSGGAGAGDGGTPSGGHARDGRSTTTNGGAKASGSNGGGRSGARGAAAAAGTPSGSG